MRAAKAIAVAAFLCTPLLCAAPSHCQIGASSMVVYKRTPKHGPRLMIDARRGWAVNTGAVGSVIQKTSNGGKTWQDRTPPGFADIAPDLGGDDVFPTEFSLSALGSGRLWVSFNSMVNGRRVLVVERTQDGGQHWRRAVFSGEAEATDLQFLDTRHGFLLAEKFHARHDFYATSDGGKTWTQGGSPDQGLLLCYSATGMTFRTAREGWITGVVRSDPPVPLIHTRDGGRTWQVQEIDLPKPHTDEYADTYSMRFHGRNRRQGAFTVRMHSSAPLTVNYITHDGGGHWTIAPPARRKHP